MLIVNLYGVVVCMVLFGGLVFWFSINLLVFGVFNGCVLIIVDFSISVMVEGKVCVK